MPRKAPFEAPWQGTDVRPHGNRRIQPNVYAYATGQETTGPYGKHVSINGAEDIKVVSALSTQVQSKKKSCPIAKFGLEDRRRAARVQFISESHSAMNPTCSPGPAYNIKSNFNDPILGAPSYTFGESRENIPSGDSRNAKFKVGPGAHGHKEGIGTQVQSKNISAPAFTLSRGLREKGDRQYVPGFEREMCAKYTPGPGTHQIKDSIETGAPNRTKMPAYSFHPEHFTGKPKEKEMCGPGRYETDSAIGSQATSKRRNQPSFRFGAQKRERNHARKVPGVGTYESNKSSVGAQYMTYNKNAPSFGFGTSSRGL